MKNLLIKIVVMIIIGNSLAWSMDKPPKESKSIFGKVKDTFSTKLTPEKATQKLVDLLNSKNKQITLKDVQPLIVAGANSNATNAQGKTVLTIALEQGANITLIEFLVNNKAYVQDSTFLVKAARDNNLKKVLLLIKAGASVDVQHGGVGALYWAINHANFDMVKELVSAGADVNITTVTGNTPLLIALGKIFQNPGETMALRNILSVLMSHGAIIDDEVLQKAKETGSKKLLNSLITAPGKLKKKLE
ncbi:hypothetical protein BH09DEP1_BH09DEP1_3460 [soil metagenome]